MIGQIRQNGFHKFAFIYGFIIGYEVKNYYINLSIINPSYSHFQQQNKIPHDTFKIFLNYMINLNQNQSQKDSSQSLISEQTHKNILQLEFEKIFTKNPQKHPNFNFYMQYCRLYLSNINLTQQIQKIIQQKQCLQKQLHSVLINEKPIKQHYEQSNSDKKKRCRRTAVQIARHYQCKYERCQKSYGSQGSLNQHMKLKHSNEQRKE